MANEVVTGLDAFRNGVGGDAAGFHKGGIAPCVGCTRAAFFFDLEPHGIAFQHVIVAAYGGTLCHVGDNRLE